MLARARVVADRVIAIPEEVYLAGMCIFAGIQLLSGGPRVDTPEAGLPLWMVQMWATQLLLAGMLVVTGRGSGRLGVERSGLHLLGWTCPAYALLLLAKTGVVAASISAVFLVGYSAVCWRRSRLLLQSQHDLAEARRIVGNK